MNRVQLRHPDLVTSCDEVIGRHHFHIFLVFKFLQHVDHVISAKGLADRQSVVKQALRNRVENVLCDVEHLVFVNIDLIAIVFSLIVLILPVLTVFLKLLVVGSLFEKFAWLIVLIRVIVIPDFRIVIRTREVPRFFWRFLLKIIVVFIVVGLVVLVRVLGNHSFLDFLFTGVHLLVALCLGLAAVSRRVILRCYFVRWAAARAL